MNKADFTFFHLNRINKRSVNFAGTLVLFLSLFFSVNVSGQQLSCINELNISVDPLTCEVTLTPDAVGSNGTLILVEGLPADAITGNGTATVVIEANEVDAFAKTGMVMDITYNLYQGDDIDAPTNSCWGTFLMEDKAPPTVVCAPDATVSCSDYDGTQFIEPLVGGNTVGSETATITECTDVVTTYVDSRVNDKCVSDVITRTYRVTDVKGNVGSCSQSVTLTPETTAGLTLPPYYDGLGDRDGSEGGRAEISIDGVDYTVLDNGPIQCSDLGLYNMLANDHPSPDAHPTDDDLLFTGRPGGFECGTILANFEDLVVDVCVEAGVECAQKNPSFKIIREWTIIDWCNDTNIEYRQIIKIVDTIAPVAGQIDDVTISTDLWGCGATMTLPAAKATDNCTADEGITVTYGSSTGTIVGNVLILPSNAKTMLDTAELYINYSDCCGNTTTDTVKVTVRDQVPPVVVADAHTVVSLSQYNENGLAKVHASTFDDGSHDGCGPISMKVRRMTTNCTGDLPGEGSIEGDLTDLENEDGKDDDKLVDGDGAGTDRDDLWFDYIHFCCEDVNESPIMVVFQVCDDANMDGISGGPVVNDVADYCNTAMVEVTVQDKLPPACSVPADTEINCIELVAIQNLLGVSLTTGVAADDVELAKIDALFGKSLGAATCNVETVTTLEATENCGTGDLTRTVVVTNTVNNIPVTCVQDIQVTVADANILTCDDITFPENSLEDIMFTKYIKDNYKTSSAFYPNFAWCLTNNNAISTDGLGENGTEVTNFPAIQVMDCEGVTITAPVVNIDNLCSEVGINLSLDTFNFNGGGCKKILAHWEIIDQCLFQENYLHKPTTDPKTWEVNPFVAENGYFEIYVEYDLFDTVGPEITCGEGSVVGCDEALGGSITATAIDACTTDASFLGWSWRLDVGNTGEYNADGEGDEITPAMVGLTAFPAGTHRVTWIVSDGCGNTSSKDCIFGLEQKDEKAPTPYCYDGLSTAVMLMSGDVTLWAADFDAGSFDACDDFNVIVSILPEADVVDESDDERANIDLSRTLVENPDADVLVYGHTFDCDDIANGIAATIDVRVYVEDQSGNFDYCTASLRLQDNLGGCPDVDGALIDLGGKVATEGGNSVDNVVVEAMANSPEFPKYENTDADGNYAFLGTQASLSYEISSARDDNQMNGVSTLDLVMIQKHILNIEALDSPYKRIAADINNDSSIKVADLLQLRKLILGLYDNDKLPSNESWRFVDANFQFADAANPFPFNEVINIESADATTMAESFVAVKVGDVNGNVALNGKTDASVRSNKTLTFALNNKDFAAGEIVELAFTSADFDEVYGYQFSLEFAKELKFNNITPGVLDVTESNFGLNRLDEGVITTSYSNVRGVTTSADDVLFTVTFVANASGSLSNMVNVSSKKTAAEAYVGAGLEITNVDASFRTNEGSAVTYVLHQNEPNPFKGATVIGYELPEAANAVLTVYDVTGKVLRTQTDSGAKGYNFFEVKGLDASGVLYYQLESDDFTATKKMIIIE